MSCPQKYCWWQLLTWISVVRQTLLNALLQSLISSVWVLLTEKYIFWCGWNSHITKRTSVDSLVECIVYVAVIETAVPAELRPIAAAVVSRWSLCWWSPRRPRRGGSVKTIAWDDYYIWENCRILCMNCCGDGWTHNAGRSDANWVRRRRQSEMRKILLGARWSR